MKKAESSFMIAKFHENPPKEPDKIYWYYWAITIAYYSMLYSAKAAILSKGYEVKTHEAAEIALGTLLIPSELEKEDLELLDQAHKIFEDEYVKYFHDARNESSVARYKARPSYTERQLKKILEDARLFISKISLILEE
jgi:uncharacterized protein (UPF0332 family)